MEKAPYVQEWMIEMVMNSLPYVADRSVIKKKLEDAKGNADAVLTNLLDETQVSDSASSRHGSSSIEREPDSDDDDIIGPKKKQDRRLSRASRNNGKEKNGHPQHDLAMLMKDRILPLTQESSSPPAISVNDVKLDDPDETEEEDWQNDSPYRDSESASVSTSASDYSTASKSPAGGVRLKLTQPKRDNEKLQPPMVKNSKSNLSIKPRQIIYTGTARQFTGTVPPTRRRYNRRDELEKKKAAQKAAARDRKRTNAARTRAQEGVMPLSKSVKENTPAVEARIKVLCI